MSKHADAAKLSPFVQKTRTKATNFTTLVFEALEGIFQSSQIEKTTGAGEIT
ncbi:MAG: hypothetical protein ACI9YO_001919 [Gammaproteobacteria bacterium]|jgi:hypothetical protein